MRQHKVSLDEAEGIASAGFLLLAEEPERTSRFLSLSGLQLADLRDIAGTTDFQLAVLTYIRGDESLLLVLAARLGVDAARIGAAERLLAGPAGET
jgi:Protein of unknown function (DUF3572)